MNNTLGVRIVTILINDNNDCQADNNNIHVLIKIVKLVLAKSYNRVWN